MNKFIAILFVAAGLAAGAHAQGTVIFESDLFPATGFITTNDANPAHAALAGTYQVALLWAPGTTPVPQSSLTQIAVFTGNHDGYIHDSASISTGVATAGGTPAVFEVQGWTGNFANFAAAAAGGAKLGQTAEFVNNTGNPGTTPPGVPINLTGWDGNLVLDGPEPASFAIGGVGAVILWLFGRHKMGNRNSKSNGEIL